MLEVRVRKTLTKQKLCKGITLLELLITLSVMSILLSLAAPSFTNLIAEVRLASVADELYSSLQLARTEAVKRAVKVEICPSDDGVECLPGSDWNSGWMVWYATGGSGIEVLRVKSSVSPRVVSETTASKLEFESVGQASTAADLRVSVVGGEAVFRHICLWPSGQVTVEKDSNCPGSEA